MILISLVLGFTMDQPVLNSVLYSSQRQLAVINNKVVKKGDRIDGAKVFSVQPGLVKLAYRGKVITLKVRAMNVRGLPADAGFKMSKKPLKENKI